MGRLDKQVSHGLVPAWRLAPIGGSNLNERAGRTPTRDAQPRRQTRPRHGQARRCLRPAPSLTCSVTDPEVAMMMRGLTGHGHLIAGCACRGPSCGQIKLLGGCREAIRRRREVLGCHAHARAAAPARVISTVRGIPHAGQARAHDVIRGRRASIRADFGRRGSGVAAECVDDSPGRNDTPGS